MRLGDALQVRQSRVYPLVVLCIEGSRKLSFALSFVRLVVRK